MQIKPVIQGVIARSAHPFGCQSNINEQINYVKQAPQIQRGPKRVLIIGASSGFGLAARIALTFGGANADTIGVSFEHGPSEDKTGSAGWYNNVFFKQAALKHGCKAVNIVGDAFSQRVRDQVIEAIETYFEGEVDLVIYSLASGMRLDDKTSHTWRSVIKPIGESISGATIDIEQDKWRESILEPASEDEAYATVKVMGGEDWESWIDTLINSESLAEGCKTIAFSYVGPESTHPIYLDGTLGRAKVDLHQTSHSLNLKLANFNGGAYATVCKALVTKASVFIPTLSPYLIALYQVMKNKGTHENCIQQMQRLFTTKMYHQDNTVVDGERLIRLDEWELDSEVQEAVKQCLQQMNEDNFMELGDYAGFKEEFMKQNGFNFADIDYTQDISFASLKALKP